jgi:TRAP-type C4-dicarboxylate transport system substrate-binding protein
MVLCLCACGARGEQAAAPAAPAEGEEAAAPAEKYELVIGHVYTEDSLEHAQMLKIEEVAEAKAGGALDVIIFANEQLGAE